MDIETIRSLILTEEKRLSHEHESLVFRGYKPRGSLRSDATGISAHMYSRGKTKKNTHHTVLYVKHGNVVDREEMVPGEPNYGKIKAKINTDIKESNCASGDISGPIDPASTNAELLRKKMSAIGEMVTNDEDSEMLRKGALPANATASDYIRDFIKSKASTFSGDTKKQRIRRALGAYYGKEREKEEDLQTLKQGDIQEGFLGALFGHRIPLIGHRRHTHQLQYVLTSSSGKSLRGGKTHSAHVVAPDNHTAVRHLANYLGHTNFRVTRLDHVQEPRTRIHKEEIEPTGNLLKELPKKKKKSKANTAEEKIKLSGKRDLIDTEPTLNTLTATR